MPFSLHDELRRAIGSTDAETQIQAWYLDLDADLEHTGEPIPIGNGVWEWLRSRFNTWVEQTASAASTTRIKDAYAEYAAVEQARQAELLAQGLHPKTPPTPEWERKLLNATLRKNWKIWGKGLPEPKEIQ